MSELIHSPALLSMNLFLATAVGYCALWYFSRPYRGPGMWACGAVLNAFGVLIDNARFTVDVLGNPGQALQLAGEITLVVGVLRFLCLPPPWWLVSMAAGAICAALSANWRENSMADTVASAVYWLLSSVAFALASYALWSTRSEPGLRAVRRLVAVFFGLLAVVILASGLAQFKLRLHGEQGDIARQFLNLMVYDVGIPIFVITLLGLALLAMRRILLDSQRHADAAKANARLFESLMTAANAGVLLVRDGLVIDANKMTENLFRRPLDTFVGQPLAALFSEHPQLVSGPAAPMHQTCTIEAMRSDGQSFAAALSVVALEDGGQVVEVRDVSEQKRLEEELRRLASQDSLTGALTRRAFAERANIEFQRSRRLESSLCLAILDLDHFKRINDSFGHAAGDQVLRNFAQLMKEQTRSTDVFARFGGEEFVLLLPDTGVDEGATLLERLRDIWSREQLQSPGGTIQSTMSAGIILVGPDGSLEDWTAKADAALYQAKSEGRNRVVRG